MILTGNYSSERVNTSSFLCEEQKTDPQDLERTDAGFLGIFAESPKMYNPRWCRDDASFFLTFKVHQMHKKCSIFRCKCGNKRMYINIQYGTIKKVNNPLI